MGYESRDGSWNSCAIVDEVLGVRTGGLLSAEGF